VVVLSSGSTGLSEGLAENIFLDVITHMLQVPHTYTRAETCRRGMSRAKASETCRGGGGG
jgi:hypothetical protein